jgi:hypothetical protein
MLKSCFSRSLVVVMLLLGLVACGDEKTAPPPTATTLAATTVAISPVGTATQAPLGTATPASVATTIPAQSVTPNLTPDPNAFLGKDGVCATLVALPLASLQEVQTRFGLDKAMTTQQTAMQNFKADARAFGATLNCTEGRMAWSLNWTSDQAKLSWVFTSFADDTSASVETRVKQNLSSYQETNAAELFNFEPQKVIGLDKVGTALTQKGFKSDSKILSVTLVVTAKQAQYRVVFESDAVQPEVGIDATTGQVLE